MISLDAQGDPLTGTSSTLFVRTSFTDHSAVFPLVFGDQDIGLQILFLDRYFAKHTALCWTS